MATETNQAKLGAALRSLRRKNGWTLADVASRTGLPVSTLSKVENDKLSLTYDKLVRLSEGLQVDIAQLFSPGASQVETPRMVGRRSIQRVGEGSMIDTKNYAHHYMASDLLHKKMQPIIAECRARTLEEFGELVRHPGEEYAVVQEGTCELHTEFYAPVLLQQGDSIYFDSSMGHGYLNAGEGRCIVLSVCSAPEAQILQTFGATRTAEMDAAAGIDAGEETSARRKAAKPAVTRQKRT